MKSGEEATNAKKVTSKTTMATCTSLPTRLVKLRLPVGSRTTSPCTFPAVPNSRSYNTKLQLQLGQSLLISLKYAVKTEYAQSSVSAVKIESPNLIDRAATASLWRFMNRAYAICCRSTIIVLALFNCYRSFA